MKTIRTKRLAFAAAVIMLSGTLLLGGCVNMVSTDAPSPSVLTPGQSTGAYDAKITYNLDSTGKLELSANNIVLKAGQTLLLQPGQGFTGSARFTSSGEYFFGDIMKQEQGQNGKVIFTAIKTGKGKLQIIPNGTDLEKATDLWVTVE
jgi:hypothetical protein